MLSLSMDPVDRSTGAENPIGSLIIELNIKSTFVKHHMGVLRIP